MWCDSENRIHMSSLLVWINNINNDCIPHLSFTRNLELTYEWMSFEPLHMISIVHFFNFFLRIMEFDIIVAVISENKKKCQVYIIKDWLRARRLNSPKKKKWDSGWKKFFKVSRASVVLHMRPWIASHKKVHQH